VEGRKGEMNNEGLEVGACTLDKVCGNKGGDGSPPHPILHGIVK